MKYVNKNEFLHKLKEYPVEMGFIRKDWILEIFKEIEINIPKKVINSLEENS